MHMYLKYKATEILMSLLKTKYFGTGGIVGYLKKINSYVYCQGRLQIINIHIFFSFGFTKLEWPISYKERKTLLSIFNLLPK